MHKIIQGFSDGSFGLEVAKLAKLPDRVFQRATEIEHELSSGQKIVPAQKVSSPSSSVKGNENLIELKKTKTELEKLQTRLLLFDSLNYDELSPKQAFDLLWKFKEL